MLTTSRLGLDVPTSTDNLSAYPADAAQSLGVLDNAALITSGTLASRPTAGSSPNGLLGCEYYATDTLQFFKSVGASWQTMLVTSAWQNLPLASGINSGGDGAAARIEGNVIRLKGTLINNTGSTFAHANNMAQIPVAAWYPPSVTEQEADAFNTPGVNWSPLAITILTTGWLQPLTDIPNTGTVSLEGITYQIA